MWPCPPRSPRVGLAFGVLGKPADPLETSNIGVLANLGAEKTNLLLNSKAKLHVSGVCPAMGKRDLIGTLERYCRELPLPPDIANTSRT